MSFFKRSAPITQPAPVTNESTLSVIDTPDTQDNMPEKKEEPELYDEKEEAVNAIENEVEQEEIEEAPAMDLDAEQAMLEKKLKILESKKKELAEVKARELAREKVQASNVMQVPVFMSEAEYLREIMGRVSNIELLLQELINGR